ncbi:MAG: hypothetical protein ACI865_002789 [Flavobacteriaceae bacterium]|jgi:hypothetical protein
MKKIILSICMTVLTVAMATAQLTEGHVKYTVDVTSADPSMDMAVSMMQGTEMEMYFKGDMVRTNLTMGAMMTMSTIVDGGSGHILMLMGGMMGDKAITTTEEELEANSADEEAPEMDVELIDETKVIQGYTCKKAVLTDEEGNEMTYWYTDEITANGTGQNHMNSDIPGFPMEFGQNRGGMIMNFLVSSISKKLSAEDEKLFDTTIPAGYEVMSFEEFTSMGM